MKVRIDDEDGIKTILLGYIEFPNLYKEMSLEKLKYLSNINNSIRIREAFIVEKVENDIIHVLIPEKLKEEVFWYVVYEGFFSSSEFDDEICGHFPYKFIEAKIKIKYI